MAPKLTASSSSAAKSSGQKISVLTAYDYPTARLLEEAGIDWILVGDSLGMVVLGYPDTTSVTLEDMIHHTRAVVRGSTRTPVIVDLPINTYCTPKEALTSARKLIDAGAHAVKLEGGEAFAPHVAMLTGAGIPTMGHIGMLPQSVHQIGGYKIQGRSDSQSSQLLADALALQASGAFAIVLELVASEAATHISKALSIPTIGIGSGSECDGQVLVTNDLIGSFPWFCPKFVTQKAHTAQIASEAIRSFIQDLKS